MSLESDLRHVTRLQKFCDHYAAVITQSLYREKEIGMCHHCKTRIFGKDGMIEEAGKCYHPICKVTERAEKAEAECSRIGSELELIKAESGIFRDRAETFERALQHTADDVPIVPGMLLYSNKFHFGIGRTWFVFAVGENHIQVRVHPGSDVFAASAWKFAASQEFAKAATAPWEAPVVTDAVAEDSVPNEKDGQNNV